MRVTPEQLEGLKRMREDLDNLTETMNRQPKAIYHLELRDFIKNAQTVRIWVHTTYDRYMAVPIDKELALAIVNTEHEFEDRMFAEVKFQGKEVILGAA